MGISVTPKQRDDVDRELRRTELTRRLRERLEMVKAAALGDGGERIARWSGRSVEPVERWLARFAAGGVAALADAALADAALADAALADAARSGRPAQADAAYLAYLAALETALETPPQQVGLAFDAGRLGLRRVDLAAAVGLLGAADGRISRARLAAGALGRAWLGLRATQAHAQAPAGPGGGGRLPRRAGGTGGGGGKRGARSRSAPSSTSRTRRIWRPMRLWRGRGIARANNRRSPASGSIGASRCAGSVEALGQRARGTGARGAPLRRRTPPGSCAIWSCWTGITRRCSGRSLGCSIWCSRMARQWLDTGSAQTSRLSTLALRAREDWLQVIWLAKYAPR